MKYVCSVCGYVYDETKGDPDHGIEPGTKWEDVPEDYECPLCGVGKDLFESEEWSKETASRFLPIKSVDTTQEILYSSSIWTLQDFLLDPAFPWSI